MKWVCSFLKRMEVCHGPTVADSYTNLSAQEGELLTEAKPSPNLGCALSQCQQRSGSELYLSVEKQPSQSFTQVLKHQLPFTEAAGV